MEWYWYVIIVVVLVGSAFLKVWMRRKIRENRERNLRHKDKEDE